MGLKLSNIEINILKESFPKYFSQKSINEGRTFLEDARVLDKKIVGNILVFIYGLKISTVDITIHRHLNTFEASCSCKKKGCEHGAAAVMKVLMDFGVDEAAFLTNHQHCQKIRDEFGTKKLNQFRKIPLKKDLDLKTIILCLSKNSKTHFSDNINIHILQSDHLHIRSQEQEHSWWNQIKYDVELKYKDSQLFIKCNSCNRKASFMCEHQQGVLNNELVFRAVESMIEEGIAYDKYVDRFKERFRVSEDDLIDHFEFLFTEQGIYLQAKTKEFVIEPDELLFSTGNSNVEEEDYKISLLEEEHQYANALLWIDDDIRLIKGKWNKKRNRLISKFTLEERPLTFCDKEIIFWNNLEKASESSETYEIYAVLNENRPLLSGMMHFYQKHRGGLSKNSVSSFEFQDEPAFLHSSIEKEDGLAKVLFSIQLGKKKIKPSQLEWNNDFVAIVNGKGWLFSNPDMANWLNQLAGRDHLLFFKNKFEDSESDFIQRLSKVSSFKMKDINKVKLTNGKKQIHIREVNSFLIFEPSILYEDQYKFPLYGSITEYDAINKNLLEANETDFNEYKNTIRQLHPGWDKDYVPQMYLYIHANDALENFWILDVFEKLNDLGINIYGQENLKSLDVNLNKINVRSHIKSGIDWFEADVEINYGDLIVAKKEWVEAIKNNRQYVRLSNGTLGVLPEVWIKKLKKLLAIAEDGKDGWKISKTRFNVVEDLFEEIDDEDLRKEILTKKEALSKYNSKKVYKLPQSLRAELRPYQLHGYRWMCFLDQFGFGGCLADDMGLGKTLQVLTFLLQQKQKNNGSSLVVVPRSLLFNWAQEIEKFTPELTFLIHHGSNRQLNEEQYLKSDLIISTYDIVTRDIIELKEITWNYIILDESQAIKNPNSKRYKAIRLLSSRNKIAMTGTPIENNTFDLYAQFSFLNPGIFGSQKRFKDHFSTPIDVLGDTDATDTLRKMIQPFLLRRTKEQVASDLPEKTESIIYCDLGVHQRKQYEELKNYIKLNLKDNNIEEDNKAKFMILDGLLKLRQICNSPELVDGTLPLKLRESVKIETLINLITEDLGNHKALVFSQFVSMLSLVRKKLDELEIQYAYLDGSTRNRKESVRQFMEEQNCQIFLISIKAGNTGLNLTMADYVYILDPWWNPAVEAQAIDRTHRIGQDKKVFAYRMICKDTIEEKILELQKKKKKLSSSLIQVEENIFKSLSKEELMALFN